MDSFPRGREKHFLPYDFDEGRTQLSTVPARSIAGGDFRADDTLLVFHWCCSVFCFFITFFYKLYILPDKYLDTCKITAPAQDSSLNYTHIEGILLELWN